MAYIAPYIDSAGLHLPTYNEILSDMIDQYKAIFGSEIYLGNDSQDYQTLAIFARKVSDTLQSIQIAYDNRSPVSATGTGMDLILKLNGLARKTANYSLCTVTISGTSGTIIHNGVIRDVNGNLWDLASEIIIPESGTISVTAVCEILGAITALPGDLRDIATPTAGWISVTNAAAAIPGKAVETDSQVRSRQAISVATPSRTMLSGTESAIAALENVARYKVFENDTGSTATDPNGLGLPAHSVTCVVEGATDDDVVQAIYKNRGVGCYTNGDHTVTITDPATQADTDISFYRPTYVPIYVTLGVKAGRGYTSATTDAIKQAVTDYLNALWIYQDVAISWLEAAALSVNPNLAQPIFRIETLVAGKTSGGQAGTDITINYNEVAEGLLANIILNLV